MIYAVTLKHDNGTVTLRVHASSPERAKEIVCNVENAPLSSVIKVEESP